MTYTANSRILGTGTVSAEAIEAWFADLGPALAKQYAPDKTYRAAPAGIGRAMIDLSRQWGANHDLVAAQILHESAGWQSRIVRDKNNPSGLGAVNDNAYDGAVTFATPYDGIRATVAHLLVYAVGDGPWAVYDPRYDAVKAAKWLGTAPTLIGLNGKWAWPGTYYGQAIAAGANALVYFANNATWETPMTTRRIALAAGHRNMSGGNSLEMHLTARLTPVLAAALRARGFTVHVITPNEGRGMHPGNLTQVAQSVRADDDCFIEIHTEGNDAGDGGRGVFVVYPDWGADVDTDVRDTLGPEIAKAISAATNIPLRRNGTMSERDTGVGRQGFRLGVFGATAQHRATLTRMIIEVGAHTSPADMRLWDEPGFEERAAAAIANALGTFYRLPEPDNPPEIIVDDSRLFPETGARIHFGFRAFWEALEAAGNVWVVLGYPRSDEIPLPAGLRIGSLVPVAAAQPFDRGWLVWEPDEIEGYQVRLATRAQISQLEDLFGLEVAA